MFELVFHFNFRGPIHFQIPKFTDWMSNWVFGEVIHGWIQTIEIVVVDFFSGFWNVFHFDGTSAS